MPVIVIEAGKRPVMSEMLYERPEGEPFYEPKYTALKNAMQDVMLERVPLVDGIVIWCDEEGRLVDEPKLICNVEAPRYVGDMVGDRLIVALEHQNAGLFEPLFMGILSDEARMSIATEVLYQFAKKLIYPPEPGQVPAEPHIEFTALDEE